jgi:hypothetical protein
MTDCVTTIHIKISQTGDFVGKNGESFSINGNELITKTKAIYDVLPVDIEHKSHTNSHNWINVGVIKTSSLQSYGGFEVKDGFETLFTGTFGISPIYFLQHQFIKSVALTSSPNLDLTQTNNKVTKECIIMEEKTSVENKQEDLIATLQGKIAKLEEANIDLKSQIREKDIASLVSINSNLL